MRTREAVHLRVGVIGLGYMGLATGISFAAHGITTFGCDIQEAIRSAVTRGTVPFFEPGLRRLLKSQVQSGRFHIVESTEKLTSSADVVFLCVPTPSLRSRRIDLRPLKRSSEQVGRALRATSGYRVVVVKSTVVPGTTESVVAPIIYRLSKKSTDEVGLACNPEFLAEGTMVHDAMNPDRIVLGTTDARSLRWLRRLYRPFRSAVFCLTPAGAELVKYSANAFLASKVSFANEVSRLADRLGVNVDTVMTAVGYDPRIGAKFLRAGPGFGGSCFEKDLRALVYRSRELGVHFRSGETALRINDDQLAYALERIRTAVGLLSGKRLALLGLSFKAGTDDVRGSRALPLARKLVSSGATVRCHDPVAVDSFRRVWHAQESVPEGRIEFADTVEQALEGADVAVLQADWPIYTRWRRAWTTKMKRPVLVDLRRALLPETARRAHLKLIGLGSGDLPRLRNNGDGNRT